MKVLGIDIGTTTISLVVLDPEQKKSMGIQNHFPMEHLWRLRGNGNGYRM